MTFDGFLPREQFDSLLKELTQQGFQCLGPTVKDDAIGYAPISSSNDFPLGIQDLQNPGHYQLKPNTKARWFDWANGPQALKPLVFTPEETLWQVKRDEKSKLSFKSAQPSAQATAIIGVRACDLAALALQDQHFLNKNATDEAYQTRRESLFLIAVNCTQPAETCFCVASGDGPNATDHFDLLLDECDEGFALTTGSDKGKQVVKHLSLQPVSATQQKEIASATQIAIKKQTRNLPQTNIQELLYRAYDSERWQAIAERCLSCGNCTAVCPTCFCHSEHDEPSADGSHTRHFRQWDSCFTQGHSYIHGIVLRSNTSSRYRQWLTHKFAGWIEQYGRSGCVGCGRCISWCPVGIDVTEELHLLAKEEHHAS